MNSFAMLVRREFWEHRSLYIAPLIWAGIIVVLSAWLLFVVLPRELPAGVLDAANIEQIEGLSESDRAELKRAMSDANNQQIPSTVSGLSFLGIAQMISAFTCVVVFFYLIDCLFTERRDRSIFFWKSMPVSDSQVVLSKLTVALVVVPIGVIVLAAATQLILYSMVWMRFSGHALGGFLADFTIGSWLRSLVVELAIMLCGILWYAPIAGYFLLLSVWARKLVFLWAIVPLVAVPALEGFFFHSTHVLQFIGQRFGGYVEKMHLNTSAFNIGTRDVPGPHVGDILSSINVSGVLLSPETWIGVAAAAAMVFLTIRIRRYRDES